MPADVLYRPLLFIQLATTLPLVGLIWLVQLVQYPLMADVGVDNFVAYHAGHTARISLVVVPLMLAELAAAGLMLSLRPSAIPASEIVIGAVLVAVVWGSTFLWQVPMHSRLASGFDPVAWESLVKGNWLRTFGWTLRGALVLWWTRLL